MGRDKALLPVCRPGEDGTGRPVSSQTLIEVVIERIQSLVEPVVVIGSPRNVQRLGERLAHTVLTDLKPDCGPLMGIYTGLMSTETALNLFVPCDMPWVEGQLIERLLSLCQGDIRVVANLHPVEGVQPFPLICDVKACRTIGALLDRGERSLQALMRHPNTQLVRIEEPGLWRSFTNVNTVADYAKLAEETPLTRRS
ncbi:MAG: molybdenum cofactor guanylyltransferase [Candidatus Omnitrophica bacterium]|nr:molybdenum cofactor guanylyltransferase [Candidatus Omnitrophota bacterium]